MANQYAGLGHGVCAGIEVESTWGTAAGSGNGTLRTYFPVTSIDIKREAAPVARNHMKLDAGRVPRSHHVLTDDCTVTMAGEVMFGAMGDVWLSALGAVATTGAGPYTHTYTLADPKAGFTIEDPGGTDPSATLGGGLEAKQATGVVCQNLTVEGTAGDFVTWSWTGIGKTNTADTQGSPSITWEDPAMAHQGGVVAWNSVNFDWVKSFRLSIETGVIRRRHVGSKQTARPTAVGPMVVRLEVEVDDQTRDLYDGYLAETKSDLTFTLTFGSDTITITLHDAQVVEYTEPRDTQEVLSQRAVFAPNNDGTDLGLSVVVVNGNANHYD